MIVQGKAELRHPPQVDTGVSIDQSAGSVSLVQEGLAPLLDQAPELKKELAPLQEKTAAALAAYRTWLQNDLRHRSTGDFRLGQAKFRKKRHLALASDIMLEEVMTRAEADLKATHAAIYETALPLHQQSHPEVDDAAPAYKRNVQSAAPDHLPHRTPANTTNVD